MKVYIGPYVTWWGPYQIAELLKYVGVSEDTYRAVGKWLAKTWVGDLCDWIHLKKQRTVRVRLHKYDSWSVDHTLALIIAPLLRQLKETKHGSPFTDESDVPENLRTTVEEKAERQNDWDDGGVHRRWAWILDEIIWTFEQLSQEDADAQFFDHSEVDPEADGLDQLQKIRHDLEAHNKYDERISNGLRLFGKYYRGLWD